MDIIQAINDPNLLRIRISFSAQSLGRVRNRLETPS